MRKKIGIALTLLAIICAIACGTSKVVTKYVGESDCIELLQAKNDSLLALREKHELLKRDAEEMIRAYDKLRSRR